MSQCSRTHQSISQLTDSKSTDHSISVASSNSNDGVATSLVLVEGGGVLALGEDRWVLVPDDVNSHWRCSARQACASTVPGNHFKLATGKATRQQQKL